MKNIVFIFLFIPLALTAQRNVSGKITDAEDNTPVVGASVFISNTTIGAFTDAEGRYQLQIPERGSYRLTISYIGYQSVFKDIEPGKTPVEFNAALHVSENELKEVTVTAKAQFRQGDVNLFWKTILGTNPSQKTLWVTNPDSVYFYYNPETRLLKVTCRGLLHIVNYETGYKIDYVLNHFTYDYKKNISDWSDQYVFTKLEPDNLKQQNNWERKRQDVYNFSLTKFIKSLYNNTLQNDGFVLATFSQNPDPSHPYKISLLNPESILSGKADDNSKTLNLSNQQVMLICYGRSVTANDLYMIQQTQTKGFYNNLLMNLLHGESIRIFPDGTYANILLMSPVNLSNTLLGLNMKLPIEYHPEELTPSIAEKGNAFDYDSISQCFDKQTYVFPQEKLHLHTDRDYYVPGEKIWFKAYLTDAATLQPAINSRYVYVELINAQDSLINRVMLLPENDMFYGNIFLSTNIPEGNYTLRAYTRYMENLGDDYFFKKNIRIGNLVSDKKQISSPAGQQSSRTQTSADNFDVSFFPEGGNLVEGVACKVAFKALNRNGCSESITGKITDEAGSTITSIETVHAGMGVFSFIPKSGKRYFLKCRNANGLEKEFELPQVDSRACALTVSQQNNMLTVRVLKSATSPDIPLYLLVHCRGQVFYFASLQEVAGQVRNDNKDQGVAGQVRNDVEFSEESLPAGVLQFVLFDEKMNPLSERLAFSKNYDCARVEFHTDSETYKTREHVVSNISLVDSIGNPLTGDLSVAITDDKDIAVDSTTSILSSLLLSSELKGYIENSAYYLQDNPESTTALDYLMLTHGWRRYSIPDVVKGNYSLPQIPFQTSQEISGKVKSGNRSKSTPDSEVLFMSKNGDFKSTLTDKNGDFKFQDFEYPDSTVYLVQALGKNGSSGIKLVLDSVKFPPLIHASIPLIKEESGAFIAKAEQRSWFDENMRVIQLGEVVITGQKKIERKEETRRQFWANIGSDVTIKREQIERIHPRLVSDILRLVPEVKVANNGYIYIGPPMTLLSGTLPLVYIDGVEVSWPMIKSETPNDSPLELVNASEVESIDVFKGTGASLFGARGAGGVISITTKRGLDVVEEVGKNSAKREMNYAIYTPLGYQKPVEFYSPKYETLDAKNSNIPDYRTTIFWKPDIVVSDTGETSFDFYTSDFPTTYSVVIEGLTNDGKIVREVKKIRVE